MSWWFGREELWTPVLERAAHPCHIEGACVSMSSPFSSNAACIIRGDYNGDSAVCKLREPDIEGLVVPTTLQSQEKRSILGYSGVPTPQPHTPSSIVYYPHVVE